MNSESNPFYRLAEQNSNPFYRLAQNKKALGEHGSVVGGFAGKLLETATEAPSQIFKELPVAGAKALEAPIGVPQTIANIISSLVGPASPPEERETFLSHLSPPEKTKMASEILGEYFRQNLPEHLHGGAEAISDVESMLMPFLKNAKVPEFVKKGTPISSGSPPGAPPFKIPSVKETTSKLKKLGGQVKEIILGPNIAEEIPKTISPEKFKNTTKAGMELERAVSSPYKRLTRLEKKAYDRSRAANRGVEAIHPKLEASLKGSLEELEKIPDPSAPLKRFIESTKKVLNNISERAPSGELVGYKPISNQVLIDQIQEYNQIPKFDFPTDTKTGIFKTLINKLTEAVDKTAKKFPQANRSWKKAKELHARKSELFADPDVSKWTKLSDKNYSKEFRSSIDIDKIRKIKPVLEETAHGRDVLQKMKRDLVEKTFEDYFPLGKRFERREIAAALSELEPILTKKELHVVERLFEEAQTPGAKAASLGYKFYKYFKKPVSTALKDVSAVK